MRFRIRDLAYVAMGAAFLTLCSWISIPMLVPFTLQTFAVCLIAAVLGWKSGTLTVGVYILLALAGVPVLSGFRGGIAALAGPTGGYVIGFFFTALITGLAAERLGRDWRILASAMIVGLLICYAFGTVWFVTVYSRGGDPMSFGSALMMCVVPYLIPDAAKIALAVFLTGRLYPLLKRNNRI